MRIPKQSLIQMFVPLAVLLSALPKPVSGEPDTPLSAVMILKTEVDAVENATAALEGYLSDLEVALLWEAPSGLPEGFEALYAYFDRLASERAAEVVFLIDVTAIDSAALYISLPRTGTTLVRHIDCADESAEGRLEVVGVIIRGILGAMTTSGEIGVHIPEVQEPETVPPPRAEEPPVKKTAAVTPARSETVPTDRGVTLGFRAGYGLGVASRDIPFVHNFRLSFGGELSILRVFAAYRVAMPLSTEDARVAMTLYPHPISVGVGLQKTFSRWSVGLGTEAIVDPVSFDVIPKANGTAATHGQRAFRVAVSPFAVAARSLTSQASFYMGVSVDMYVFQPAYYVTVDGEDTPFLSLWSFSPFVQIGLEFGFGS